MKETLSGILNKSISDFEEYSISHIRDHFNLLLSLQKKILSTIQDPGTPVHEQKSRIKELIAQEYTHLCAYDFSEVHREWIEKESNYILQIPIYSIEHQKRERFTERCDIWWRRPIKKIKLFTFTLTTIPHRVVNLFSKRKTNIPFWKHKIRTRALFQLHFLVPYIKLLNELDILLLERQYEIFLQLKAHEQKGESLFDIDLEIKNFYTEWKRRLDQVLAQNIADYQHDYVRAGTIDYANSLLSVKSIAKIRNKAILNWRRDFNGLGNWLYALFEDWRSDLEVTSLASFTTEVTLRHRQMAEKWISDLYENHVAGIVGLLEQEKNGFLEESGEALENKIRKSRYRIKKELDSALIEPLVERLSKNTVLNQLNLLLFEVEDKTQALVGYHSFLRPGTDKKRLSGKDFQSISNYELISFELLPTLTKKLEAEKTEVLKSIEQLTTVAGDLDNIIVYTLTSSLSNEELPVTDKAKAIADGISRAQQKLSETHATLNQQLVTTFTEVTTVMDHFSNDLISLTQNENIYRILYRISKAKTVRKSLQLRNRMADTILVGLQKVKERFTAFQKSLLSTYSSIRSRLVPTKAFQEQSRTISDFIQQSEQTIAHLPKIYQRLYAVEPLNDKFLFEGRDTELQKIDQAYQTWKQGKFSSVLLYGEKWSGITSLLNVLPASTKFSIPVVRITFKEKIQDASWMMEKLNAELHLTATNWIELEKQLQEGFPKVIILEDLQHVFLKKMHGKNTIKLLLRLIAKTQKSIFWICTLSNYAYQYLDKTLHISGFFSYPIKLRDFKNHEIRELIVRRNRISGYEIIFEADQKRINNKKYQKLAPDEQQQILERKFFDDMTEFAKSNISMALIFWLLSTRKIEGRNLFIKPFEKPDMSILSYIPKDKSYVLQLLVLHDGLDLDSIAVALNKPVNLIELMILEMIDDGIIYVDQKRYIINALVFRNIIQLLKSRNLLSA